MTFFFDVTPLIAIAAVLGFAVVAAIAYVFYSLFRYRVYIPLKHWKTGLKLYQFQKQVFNDRVIEERWFENDNQARQYQSRYDFYPFCTREVYPKLIHLDDKAN
jgi:hypothetical protein